MQSSVAAGLVSGAIEGVIIAPFERVKVYIQVHRQRMSEVSEGNCVCKMVGFLL